MYVSAIDIIKVKSNFSLQNLKERLDLVRRLVMQESKNSNFDFDLFTQGFLELYWNFSYEYENDEDNIEWDEESPYFLKLKNNLIEGEKEMSISLFEVNFFVDFEYKYDTQFLNYLKNIQKNIQSLFSGAFKKAGFEVMDYLQYWE